MIAQRFHNQTVLIKIKNISVSPCFFRIFFIFVLSRCNRAEMPEITGYFILGPLHRRHCSYRDNLKRLQGPVAGLDTVKSDAVFHCSFLNLSKMSKNATLAPATNLPIGINPSQKIINELLVSDDMDHLRDHLRTMLDTFLLEEHDMTLRRKVFASFKTIDRVLFEVEQIDKLNTKVA